MHNHIYMGACMSLKHIPTYLYLYLFTASSLSMYIPASKCHSFGVHPTIFIIVPVLNDYRYQVVMTESPCTSSPDQNPPTG